MQQMTDEQLDQVLGTDNKNFPKYRVISIDNGKDISGTGATGFFIEKKYNQETNESERIPVGEKLKGVILAAKAQLIHKDKNPLVRTEEFDPGTKEPIKIYPLSEGKLVKDQAGNIRFTTMSYKDIKKEKLIPAVTLNGQRMVEYGYFMILYVGLKDEVVKFKFKGAGRGNFFDYSKLLGTMHAKLYNVNTIFTTYIDKEYGKYTIKFDVELDKKGVPTEVDPEMVRGMRMQVAQSLQSFSGKQLGAPAPVPQIDESYGPEDEQPEYDDSHDVQISDLGNI